LGVELLDRKKRPFVLTPEGELCYEKFRELVELYDNLQARLQAMRGEVVGTVRVGAIYSVGLHDMSHCMREFLRRYPKANVRLEFLHPARIYDSVLTGELDLGIVSYPSPSAELEVIPLREERMILVSHPDHRFAKLRQISPKELQHEAFVAFDRGLVIRKQIDRYLREYDVTVKIVMAFDNIETIKQAVEIGAGVSILPEPTIRTEVARGTLVPIELRPGGLTRPIGIILQHRKVLTPTMAKFIELLQNPNACDELATAADKPLPNEAGDSPTQV